MPAWLLPAALAAGSNIFSEISAARARKKRTERIDGLFREIESNRQRRKAEAVQQIGTYTRGLRKSGEARAQRMELASGREGSATALAPAITGRIARAGSDALQNAFTTIDQSSDQQKMGLEYERAREPIEPGAADYISSALKIGSRFATQSNMEEQEELALKDQERRAYTDELRDEIDQELTEEFQGYGSGARDAGYARRSEGRRRRMLLRD